MKDFLTVTFKIKPRHRFLFGLVLWCLSVTSASAFTCTESTNVALAANGGTASISSTFSGFGAQEKAWQNIVPLHSSRTDVERLLGSPQESRGLAATFNSKDGRVRVFYSDGYCQRPGTNDWNVPANTVVSLTFEPSSELLIAELKLDMSKFERDVDPHLQRAVHYYSREAGIRISTRLEKDGEDVHSITYEPAEKDLHLRCPNNSHAGVRIVTQQWREIEPLKTTRAEVERLLGKADGDYGVLYQLKDGSLFIEYSSGPCRPDRVGRWNVPENVVVSMSFTPRQRKKISQLKLNLTKLRKVVDEHLPGYVYYIDDDKGIVYSVERGVLHSIEYGPSTKDEPLECHPRSSTGSTKFDEYGVLPRAEEEARLDNFAYQLRSSQRFLGYIIVYRGGSVTTEEVLERAERTKAYLVRKGVEATKLFVIDDGQREEFTVELFVTIKDTIPPRPRPTVVEALHPDPVESDPPPGIKLLTGYKHKSGTDFEGNQVGEIFKPDGVKVKYEIGLSQGMAIEKQQRHRYLWFREQVVNKRTIRYALDKENSLIISVALDDDPDSLHAANFVGTIKKPEDLGDMLLMILPFTFKQTSDR